MHQQLKAEPGIDNFFMESSLGCANLDFSARVAWQNSPTLPGTAMMALRKKPPVVLALVAALLFIGGGALTIFFMSRRNEVAATLPVGSNVIPDDAVLTLSLTSDSTQWRRLRQFGTEATRPQLDQVLSRWRNRLLVDNGLNFETDLTPLDWA